MKRLLILMLAGVISAGVSSAGAQEIDVVRSNGGASRLDRILLVLEPGAQKRAALDTLLSAQQMHGNANFHQWLTPAQYADKFAVSAVEAASVVSWLRAQGFTLAPLPTGRGWIEFSGSKAQVERAFGAKLQSVQTSTDPASRVLRYRLSGEVHIPSTIAPLVKGLASLDGALAYAATTSPVASESTTKALAAESSLISAKALTPALAREWLGFSAQATSGPTGAGEAIAIPSRSNVRAEDFAAFRKSFGLPETALDVRLRDATTSSDQGRNSDEASTIAAASWAGVAAPEARIVLVPVASTNATDGIDLALSAIVDGALAHTVSVGYTACESALSDAHRAFYAAAYKQAAAQGMAIVAATGDSGAAACHLPEDTTPIRTGRSVNAIAATPWNTAVGAVAFAASADSVTGWEQQKANQFYATGGGASSDYATPDWQSAVGLPATDPDATEGHHRYLPDISLPAAGSGRGLAFCFSGDTSSQGCRLVTSGGSAASAAIFSGIAALLAEQYGAQGNLAPNLYILRRATPTGSATEPFTDVTTGSARLSCLPGTSACVETTTGKGEIGFSAAFGFDLVSGLGTVNGQALVENWANPQATGTANVTVQMTNTGGITYNPSATVVLAAKVTSGSGGVVPTGTVQFYDQTTSGNTGTPVTLAADGTASYSETGQFTAGGHNIAAIYSGDTTYKAATSQPVTINIQPSPTALVVTPSTTTPTGGSSITVVGTVTSPSPGASAPTGTLTVNLDGIASYTAKLATVGSATTGSVTVTVPTSGSHTVQGTYSGDLNYNTSTSPSVTIAVSKTATVTTIAASPSTISAGVPETLTATLAPSVAVSGTAYVITGTVSFYDAGTTLLGTATISSNTAVLTGITLSTTASHTVTAVYSGDTAFSTSTSSPLVLDPTLLPVTVTLVASNAVLTPEQPVTLTATVTPVNTPPLTAEQNPSGFIFFFAGNTLISGQVQVLQGIGHTGIASAFVPHLPAGQYVITAQYSGDPTYGAAVSNSVNLQIQDFTIISTTNNINIQQGQTTTVPFTVSSLGGLTGPIQVACEEQNPPQTGAIQCTFAPNIVDGSGTAVLTVITTGGAIARNDRLPSPFFPVAGGGVALAFVGILLMPIGRRARWLRMKSAGGKLLVLALLLAGLLSAGVGCTNTVTLNTTRGTPLGVHTLKITAASYVNTVTVSHNAYLTVNVTP